MRLIELSTLTRRAVELDNRHADLGLGFADACVMAIAEQAYERAVQR